MTEIRQQTAWQLTPYIRREGMYSGTIIRIRNLDNADGVQILMRPDGIRAHRTRSSLPRELYDRIYKEKMDADGSVKFGIFVEGWQYSGKEGETQIETLLTHLRPNQHIVIRMGKNWRGKRYYCRYIKNDSEDEWSGFEKESDWRESAHSYPYMDESGTYEFQIYGTERNDDSFIMETGYSDRNDISRYTVIVPKGTQAYDFLIQNRDISHTSKFILTIEADEESGKSYCTEIHTKERKPRTISKSVNTSYADIKKVADMYGTVKNEEYDATNGIYDAVIVDDDALDYRHESIPFIKCLLSDGRVIMPEMKKSNTQTKAGKEIQDIIGNDENLILNRKNLWPGMDVTLYFTKSQKGGNMILRAITTDESDERIMECGVEYMGNKTLDYMDLDDMDDEHIGALYDELWKNRKK